MPQSCARHRHRRSDLHHLHHRTCCRHHHRRTGWPRRRRRSDCFRTMLSKNRNRSVSTLHWAPSGCSCESTKEKSNWDGNRLAANRNGRTNTSAGSNCPPAGRSVPDSKIRSAMCGTNRNRISASRMHSPRRIVETDTERRTTARGRRTNRRTASCCRS